MKFNKIRWCLKQSKGIKLTEPNDSISENHIRESWSDFDMIEKVNKKWKTVTSYYSCYNSVYAILVKIGIKCEIHDCTIALMDLIGFDKENIKFLDSLKRERVDIQYYLLPSSLDIDKSKVLEFLNRCKEIIKDMNDLKIEKIRKEIKEVLE